MTAINSHSLMNGVEKYVVSGALAGLTAVQWHNEQGAWTDGTTIHLPILNALANEDEVLLWRYMAEHELGHEDHVNAMPHWKEVMEHNKKNPLYKHDDLLWMIANLLSDHVQERNRVGNMTGRDYVLKHGRQMFLQKMVWPEAIKGAKSKEDIEHKKMFNGLFLWETEQRIPWNDQITMPSIGKDAETEAARIKRDGGVVLNVIKNEQEVFEAAVKLRKLWPAMTEEERKEREEAEAKADAEAQAAKDAVKKYGKAVPGVHGAQYMKPTEGEKGNPMEVRTPDPKASSGSYRARIPVPLGKSRRGGSLRTAVPNPEVTKLVRSTNLPAKVRAFLMSQRRERWDTGFRKGRLDTGRLTEVLHGKDNLFKQRAPIHMTNSAVSLLIDSSGSMHGRRYHQACASAVMLAEALQGVGVNLEIAGFTEFSGRNDGLIHEVFLPFGQRFVRDTFLRKVAQMENHLSNNADGENILYAYNRLKMQQQGRKILVVLSDGEPAAEGPHGSTMEIGDFTKQVIEMIERDKGVNLVSLGMDGYDTKRYYKNAIKVNRDEPLERVLLDMVKNSVLC